jgi:hypothetical protein
MQLIHLHVAGFALDVLKSQLTEWCKPAIDLIAEIMNWSEDHCVRFVGTPLVEWLCQELQGGPWAHRVLAVSLFVRMLHYARHATIVETINQSDFLNDCLAIIGSDDATLAAHILIRFVELWEGSLRGVYTHVFLRKVMKLIDDEDFLEGVFEARASPDQRLAEAALRAIEFLRAHGKTVGAPE